MGTSYLLPRLVGASRAAELMLTGRVFDADEARAMELVLDVVPDGDVVDRALRTARQIVAHSPLAVWMTKETMWQTIDSPIFRHALDMENRTQIMCTQTGELSAAAEAFREGRPPNGDPCEPRGILKLFDLTGRVAIVTGGTVASAAHSPKGSSAPAPRWWWRAARPRAARRPRRISRHGRGGARCAHAHG